MILFRVFLLFIISFQLSFSKDSFTAKPILIDYKGIIGKDSTIIAYGNYGSCLVSYDGDKTWVYKKIFDKGIINQMFIEDERIVAFTSDGQVAVSYDNSITWELNTNIDITTKENDIYNYTHIISSKNGYVIRKKTNVYFTNKEFQIVKTIEYPLDSLDRLSDDLHSLKSIIYENNSILIMNKNIIYFYDDNFELKNEINIKEKFQFSCNDCLSTSSIFVDKLYYYLKIDDKRHTDNHFKISKDFNKIEIISSVESNDKKNTLSIYGLINNRLYYYDFSRWFKYYIYNSNESIDLYFDNRSIKDALSRLIPYSNKTIKQSYYYNQNNDKLYITYNNNTIYLIENFSNKSLHNFREISAGGFYNLQNINLFEINNDIIISEQNTTDYDVITSNTKVNSNFLENRFLFDIDPNNDTINDKKADNLKLNLNNYFQFITYRKRDSSIIIGSRPDESWNEFYISKDGGRYYNLFKKYIDTIEGKAIFRDLVSNRFNFNNKLNLDFMCHGRQVFFQNQAPFFRSFFSLLDDEMNTIHQISIRDEISFLAYFTNMSSLSCFGTSSLAFDYSIKSTTNNGADWDTLKTYDIDLFIQEYKEFEINGKVVWAISYFDESNNTYSIDIFDLETKEIKTIFNQVLSDMQTGQLQFITFDGAKEKFYLTFYNTLMVSSNIFEDNIKWETFNYPNNGKVNKKFQIFDKTIFARYEDDKNEDNVYWINGIEMVGDPTGVEDNSQIEEVSYLYTMPPYPNPTVSEVTAKFYWDSRIDIDNSEIAVFDITGNKVSGKESLTLEKLNEWSGNIKWNCVGQPKGTYLIKIQHGNNTKAVKVVVN